MYKTLAFIVCISSFLFATAQYNNSNEKEGKNDKMFYAELGGPGVLFSANMDVRFKPNTRVGWGARAGIGFTVYEKEIPMNVPGGGIGYTYETKSIATIPLGFNYVFGKPNSANTFEVGAGATVLTQKAAVLSYDYSSTNKEGNLLGNFSFMYRRVPMDGGFAWRIGFTPVINADGQIFPTGAASIGYSFR